MTPLPTAASPDATPSESASAPLPRVLVLVAHPDLHASRVNRQLLRAARTLQTAHAPRIEVRDLYALYPDFDIDVRAEQQAAAAADLIVWQHPIHWYSMPALMKLWLDEVLTQGWAYGRGGTALMGKDLWLVASTGGPEATYHPERYNRYFFDAFLPPYEQTAALCGLRFLPPLVLHGANSASAIELAEHSQTYLAHLRDYPAWPEIADLPACVSCPIPPADRPDDRPENRWARDNPNPNHRSESA
jgi:glutathione-regulated potassium-efflux system ancillary protein KefF